MNANNFVKKLKRIVREKEQARRNIMCERERVLQCEETIITKDEKWREEQVPQLRFVNPQFFKVRSPSSFPCYNPGRQIEESLHHLAKTRSEA
jgi:hypothetical protein